MTTTTTRPIVRSRRSTAAIYAVTTAVAAVLALIVTATVGDGTVTAPMANIVVTVCVVAALLVAIAPRRLR